MPHQTRTPRSAGIVRMIAEHTVLGNLYDLRFTFSLLVVLIICAATAMLSVSNVQERHRESAALSQQANHTANLENRKLVLSTPSLSFLFDGQEDRLPKYVIVTPDFIDYPIEDISARPMIEPYIRVDWAFIVIYFYGVLAILLTFDLISRPRESGTLAMVLSQNVSRGIFFLGSYAGAFLTLGPAVLLGLLIYSLVAHLHGERASTAGEAGQYVAAFVLSLLYMSAVALMGLAASAAFRKSASALACAFLVWASLTIVLPAGASICSNLIAHVHSFNDLNTRIGSARARYLSRLPAVWSMDVERILGQPGLTQQGKQEAIARYQQEILEKDAAAIEGYKREVREQRADYLAKLKARDRLESQLGIISPAEAFQQAVESALGTGMKHWENFVRSAETYEPAYTQYVTEKRSQLTEKANFEGFIMEVSGVRVRSVGWIDYRSVDFDRKTLPPFQELKPSIRANFVTAVPACVVLICINGLLGLFALWAVRAGRVL